MIIFGNVLGQLGGPNEQLGTLPTSFVDHMGLIDLATTPMLQTVEPALPAPGTCNADKTLIWRGATTLVPGHWERLRAGEVCKTVDPTFAPTVRDHRGDGEAGGGVSVTSSRVMKVGLFTIPVIRAGAKYIWGLDDYNKITAEQAAEVKEALGQKIDYPGRSNWVQIRQDDSGSPEPGTVQTSIGYQGGKPTGHNITATWPALAEWGQTWLTHLGWMHVLGLKKGDSYEGRRMGFDTEKYAPIATFKHPDSGADYGMWTRLEPVGPQIPALSATLIDLNTNTEKAIDWATTSYQLQFMVAPLPDKGLLGGFWDWIMKYVKKVASSFYSAVWDTAEVLSETLCALTANPGQLTTTAAAGGPYAAAAAAGTELMMDGKCPVPNPTPAGTPGPPPPPPVVKKTPWGLIALGVGVAGLAAVLISQQPGRKKKTA